MGEEIKIKLGDQKYQKWQRLLLYMQNSTNSSFRMKFNSHEEAKDAYQRMHKAMSSRPTWYNLILCIRDCDVYVIKPDKAQKVVIQDG